MLFEAAGVLGSAELHNLIGLPSDLSNTLLRYIAHDD